MRYHRSQAKTFGKTHMRGVWAAIPYPFGQTGELDEAALRKDVRHYIDVLKIDGFFCGGLIGEFWSLTMEERRRGQQIVAEELGDKAQVIAHTACSSIRETVALTQHAQSVGATYAVIGNPAMNSRHPDHLFEFYRRVCAEVDIAVALFNTNFSGYALSPELVGRLADIDNIFCIKNPQPVEHIAEVRRRVGSKILVCDPTETRWLDNILTHKDQVFMSSPSPYLLQTAGRLTMKEYTRQAMAGEVAAARKASATLDGARDAVQKWMETPWQAGVLPLAAIKYWSELLGLSGGAPRPPLLPLTEDQKRELRQDLVAAGLLA
ncbi:MAG TPA: dihydrodipicolinate synthase family protein [Candidatus Methylomirabilis sp.]